METLAAARKFPHPLIWIAGVAVIAFSGVGTAALMGEQAAPAVSRPAAASVPVSPVPPKVLAKMQCIDCGVVESMREVDSKVEKGAAPARHFEITVRMRDGSNRVITEINASDWRSGDRVRVANGAIHSNA